MAISKKRKEELLAQYTDLLERSRGVIVTDHCGLTVNQITQVRDQIRQVDGAYHVTKNTLLKLATDQVGLRMPEEWLTGPTAIGFCLNEVPAVAKALVDFADKSEDLVIKGALLQDRVFGPEQVKALAKLPPLETLRAQLVGTLQSPASQLVGVLNGVLAGFVGVLTARSEQLGEAGEA